MAASSPRRPRAGRSAADDPSYVFAPLVPGVTAAAELCPVCPRPLLIVAKMPRPRRCPSGSSRGGALAPLPGQW